MDLERLDSAIEKFEAMDTPSGMYGSEHDAIISAARAYRDLANGERVWVCYRASQFDPQQTCRHDGCGWSLLVDHSTEEE